MKRLLRLTLFLFTTAYNSYGQHWLTNGSGIHYNGGRVGIGTASPTHNLHVVGHGAFTNGSVIDVAITTPGGKNGIVFSGNEYGNYSRFNLENYDNATESSRYFQLRFNQDSYGLVVKKGGNVGVGTTAPISMLDVAGNLTLGVTGSSGNTSFRRGSDGNIAASIGYFGGGTEAHNFAISSNSGGGFVSFRTNGASGIQERMRIDYDGNVGYRHYDSFRKTGSKWYHARQRGEIGSLSLAGLCLRTRLQPSFTPRNRSIHSISPSFT